MRNKLVSILVFSLLMTTDWGLPVAYSADSCGRCQMLVNGECRWCYELERPCLKDKCFVKRDPSKDPLLINAARSGDFAEVKRLLFEGADVNYCDNGKEGSALLAAVLRGHLAAARLLVKNGARINNICGGASALVTISIVPDDRTDIAKLLIENGALVNSKDDDGDTPLHLAASSEYTETLEFLLKNGADVNAKNENNCTPLFYAAGAAFPNTVRILLQNGADPNLVCKDSSPLQRAQEGLKELRRARQEDAKGVIKMLKAYGAKW